MYGSELIIYLSFYNTQNVTRKYVLRKTCFKTDLTDSLNILLYGGIIEWPMLIQSVISVFDLSSTAVLRYKIYNVQLL